MNSLDIAVNMLRFSAVEEKVMFKGGQATNRDRITP